RSRGLGHRRHHHMPPPRPCSSCCPMWSVRRPPCDRYSRRVTVVQGGGMSELGRMYNKARTTTLGTGWLTLAASLLVIPGIFKILDAIWAFKYDDDVPDG